MKKGLLIILYLFVILPCFCQIGTKNVATPKVSKQQETTAAFDSTRNYLGGKNVFSYKGQQLFVLPVSKGLTKHGYRSFYTIDYNPASNKYVRYGNASETSEYNTKYEDLANKYFYVDSVRRYEMSVIKTHYFLYLTEKDNPTNRCCFVYNPDSEHDFPFIVVSHFNYLKNRYVGKKFVIAWNYLKRMDIVTGETIPISDDTKTIWTATDISIVNDDYQKLSLIVENGSTTSCVSLESFKKALTSDDARRVYEKSEWDKLVKTYGLSMMQCAFSGKIKVGMPLKLLIMSWGRPDKINSASYGSQYVYGNQYVYVRGGKITSWN